MSEVLIALGHVSVETKGCPEGSQESQLRPDLKPGEEPFC